MSESAEEKPKIIIDEDWKSRVERERTEQQMSPEGHAAGGPAPAEGERVTADGVTVRHTSGTLPPASFELLVSTFVTQTLACLGQIPDPVENKPIVQLDLAQHHIDTLAMLEEKTRGNLTDDESRVLVEMLHQLRMLFVSIRQHVSQ